MIETNVAKKPGRVLRLGDTFAALRHRNYRLWFIGQMISLVGTWMQSTAQGYLIYQITGSPAYLGVVGFVGGLPTWLFTLYGGVVADRIPRRTLLIITQTVMLTLAFVLAALTFTNMVQPWHIVALAFLLGVANAFDAPARVSFVAEMVSREDLTNAIALNATMFNVGTVIGPAVAGVTYAKMGPGWCFTLNGISFVAIIAGLLMMRIQLAPAPARRNTALADLVEGLKYAARSRLIVGLTLFMGLMSIFGIGTMTLLPAWAKDILGGDVTTNGYLVSARGVGALIGALMLAWLGKANIRGKIWTAGSLVMPVMLFVFAWVRWLPLSLLMLVGVGWSFVMVANNSNAIVQSHVADEIRGRVMSIYTLVFFGSMPLGSAFAGFAAERLGEATTVVACSILLALCALGTWLLVPEIRREK